MKERQHTPLAVATLLLAALLSGASAPVGAQAPAAVDRGEPNPPALRLCLLNQAEATEQSLAVATREADEIWARAGLRLVWRDCSATFDPTSERTVIVIVRRVLVRTAPPTAGAKPRTRPPLGWVPFGEDGPANLIEVSLSAVTSLVMGGWFDGKPIAALPQFSHQPLIGRALGRVLAHEIGHWLGGRAHTPDGLMQAALKGRDLVDRLAPTLPRAWTRAGAAQLWAVSSRREPAPHAPLREDGVQKTQQSTRDR